MRCAFLLCCLSLLWACSDKPAPAKVPEVVKQADAPPSKAQEDPKDKPWPKTPQTTFVITPPAAGGPMIVDGNKYLAIGRATRLMWEGQPSRLPLLGEPAQEAKAVSTKTLKPEDKPTWTKSRTLILKPRPFVAKKDLVLKPYDFKKFYKLDPGAPLNQGEEFGQLELKKGQRVDLYMRTIDSDCVVGIDGEFSIISCPDASKFDSEHVPINHASAPYAPLEEQRWYQIKGDDGTLGWLRADGSPMMESPKSLDRATGLFRK